MGERRRSQRNADGHRLRSAALFIGVTLILLLYALGALGLYIRKHYMFEGIGNMAVVQQYAYPDDVTYSVIIR